MPSNPAYDLGSWPGADSGVDIASAIGFRRPGNDWAWEGDVGASVDTEGPTSYRIQQGDTLSKIGRRMGLTAAELALANPNTNQFRLHPGQSLRIPQAGSYSDDDVASAGHFLDKQNSQRIAIQEASRKQALMEKIQSGVPLLSLKSALTGVGLADGLLMTFGAAVQMVGSGEPAGQSTQSMLDSYRDGYAGRDLGVMDANPNMAAAGQLTARAGQAFQNYALDATGYTDMQTARQRWSDRSYGSALGYGVAATVNAALTVGTVVSFGLDAPVTESARAGFTWLRTEGGALFAGGRAGEGVGPAIDRLYDKYVPFGRLYVVPSEGVPNSNALGNVGAKAFVPEYVSGFNEADILSVAKGERPDPSQYLSQAYRDAHAALFKDGAVRIQPTAPAGTIGRTETWVFPKSLADDAIASSRGDVGALEKLLGLDEGYLGSAPVRVDIPKPTGYRIPTGNEFGANTFWRPGGLTWPGGLPEAVIHPVLPSDYVVKPVF